MGAEREGSKNGGGYTGGFFQLFDWTAKSRKKLFSSKTDLPERTKQRKKIDGLFPQTQVHLMDHEEAGAASSVKGSSDYSCASSVTDDEGYGNKAPGVVARLMGLDSLPTSNLSETYATPLFDSLSLREAREHRKNFNYYNDYQMMYSGNLLDKVEAPVRNPVDPKPHKILSRPIEKFQTEILPPKSAKSIPTTHHKLLSPIKSPGFIPSKNAAHIMEAAVRIIEPGPQASTKTRISLLGSSSVPFKVQAPKEKAEEGLQKRPQVASSSHTSKAKDLKEKVEVACKSSRLAEASRRPVESNAARQLKGQSMNKSWDGSPDVSFRVSPDSGKDYCGPRNNGKSISLAIQAKVNVRRRESLNSIGNRISSGHKEQSEAKPSQHLKSQPSTQKNFHKKSSAHGTSGVLRQNNQKQNFLVDREKLPSKILVSNSEGRKMLTRDLSTGHQKIPGRTSENSRMGVRKSSLEVTDAKKEGLYSSTKNVPRKKRSIDRDYHFDKKQAVDNGLTEKSMHIHSDEQQLKHKNRMPVHTSTVIERDYCAENSTKKSTDVVSFTFTAPLARPVPGSEITGQDAQKISGHCTDNRGKRTWIDSDSMKFSSVGYNVIGADSLSVFLEQKLQELTGGFDFSCNDSTKDGSASTSASLVQDLSPTVNLVSSIPKLNGMRNLHVLVNEKLMGHCGSEFSSTDSPIFRFEPKFQGVSEMDECSSSKNNDARQLLNAQHPSPVSILEPSFSFESCDSSVSIGSKLCSSVQAQEVVASRSSKLHSIEGELDLSDSASSISTGAPKRNHASSTFFSTEWELAYVKEMLSYVDFTSQDFTLGRAHDIINPHLFDWLESRKGTRFSIGNDESKLRRKVLFDCVGECIDLRCRQYMNTGYKMWEKEVAMMRRKDLLAEELYKEILGWKEMGDCMVDELVDKDMSSKYGRWLDFEVDAFKLGVEFEGRMLNSIVDEIVVDILQFY